MNEQEGNASVDITPLGRRAEPGEISGAVAFLASDDADLRHRRRARRRRRLPRALSVELLATGETVRKRTVETRDELTAQEAQIARLARDGRTNPEIGAQLYISPRTVEWHLRNVFTKLGIRSRRELHDALPDEPSAIASARHPGARRYVQGHTSKGMPPGPYPGPGGTRGRRTGGRGTVVACPVSTPKEPPSCPPRSSSSTAPSPSPRAGTASSARWRAPVTM